MFCLKRGGLLQTVVIRHLRALPLLYTRLIISEMEPLGATASVIAVLQLLSKVVEYINSASGAPKERRRLREELRVCENVLQQLKDEADDSEEGKLWSETIKALEAPGAPLGRLEIALSEIEARLKPKEGMRKALSSVEWPFHEKGIKEIFQTIEREKSLLQLALANNSRKLLQEIKRTSSENKSQLLKLITAIERSSDESEGQFSKLNDNLVILQDSQASLHNGLDGLNRRQDNRDLLEQRLATLNWLTPIDYAVQQSDFINRRQEGTGEWLLDSPEFKAWAEGEIKTLFCPGIPGAGKTMITSIVIEELLSRVENNQSMVVAYLYCDFRRQDEQSAEHLLVSLLKQLIQEWPSLPNSVKSLHDNHQKKHTRPSFNEISKALQSIVSLYPRIFIIVDALDECQMARGCRAKFLSEILNIQAKCGISLFATSRFIPDIMEKFESSMSLEIRASEQDVRRYVDGHVSHLPAFVERSLDLQEEVKTEIVKAVGDMYVALMTS